jgi:hypothetical protein
MGGASNAGGRPLRVLYASMSPRALLYYEAIARPLREAGHHLHFVFSNNDRNYPDYDRDVAEFRRVTGAEFDPIRLDTGSLRADVLTVAREVRSLSSYLNRTDQSAFYRERWEKGLPPPLDRVFRRPAVRRLTRWRLTRAAMGLIERVVPAHLASVRHLRTVRPDVVVAAPVNMRYTYEAEYVKAALQLGIPAVVPVFSWDNLTTKGLLPVCPTALLVWNEDQARIAREVHRVPADRIVITGGHLFDRWLNVPALAEDRAAFCERVGLPADRPFVSYFGSTDTIAADETGVVRELAAALDRHPDPAARRVMILIRPHPLHAKVYAGMDGGRVVVHPKGGEWPNSPEAKVTLFNSVLHSLAVTGVNTSGFLDAIAIDKVCVVPLLEKYRKTQMETLHFRDLLSANAVATAGDVAGVADLIARLTRGEEVQPPEVRRAFLTRFIRPRGPARAAGALSARAVEQIARGVPPAEVAARLAGESSAR